MRKFSYAIGIFCTVFLLSLGFYASYQYGCSKDREYSDPALEAENPLPPVIIFSWRMAK